MTGSLFGFSLGFVMDEQTEIPDFSSVLKPPGADALRLLIDGIGEKTAADGEWSATKIGPSKPLD